MNVSEARVVRAPISVVAPIAPDPKRPNGFRSRTRMAVTADEPVFAGHYPGRPIFPGVCLLDTVLRSVRLARPPHPAGAMPLGIESARFTGMVVPGDVVTVELSWQRREHGWRCSARIATETAEVARIRLRYDGCTS